MEASELGVPEALIHPAHMSPCAMVTNLQLRQFLIRYAFAGDGVNCSVVVVSDVTFYLDLHMSVLCLVLECTEDVISSIVMD
jgi:hypothetical protein